MIAPIPGSRFLRRDGACAMVTGIPAPPVNGVWTERPDPGVAGVAALLDQASGTGVPHGLRLCPGSDEAVIKLADSARRSPHARSPTGLRPAHDGAGWRPPPRA